MPVATLTPVRYNTPAVALAGFPEDERMAARTGAGVTRLRSDWQALLSALSNLGPVRLVTRNRHAVLERSGTCPECQHFGCRSLFVDEGFDLRACLPLWRAAFAVAARPADGGAVARSLHFYSAGGAAAHEIFLTRESSVDGFEEILEEFVSPDQTFEQIPGAAADPSVPRAGYVDVRQLLYDWTKLRDVLSFAGLLRCHGISRREAFVLAQGRFSRRVAPESLRFLLRRVSSAGLNVILSVGNSACVQTYRGPLRRFRAGGGWLSAGDRQMQLQLFEPGPAAAWVVERPTKAGPVASLEVLDCDGFDILSIFGARTEEGRQEPGWRSALEDLPAWRMPGPHNWDVCA